MPPFDTGLDSYEGKLCGWSLPVDTLRKGLVVCDDLFCGLSALDIIVSGVEKYDPGTIRKNDPVEIPYRVR